MEVAGVTARLGFDVDSTGAERFEQKLKKARADAAKPVEAELGASLDERVFNAYERRLEETKRRVAQRDKFRAKLGADFNAREFATAQREQTRLAQQGEKDRLALEAQAARERLRIAAEETREETRTRGALQREYIRAEAEKERAVRRRAEQERRANESAERAAERLRRAGGGSGGGGRGGTLGAILGSIGPESQDASKGLHELNFALRLIRTAGLVAAISAAIAAIGALATAAVAAVAAIGPLVGLLATIPAGAGAAIQALGTIGLAATGVGAAVKAGLNVQAAASQEAAGQARKVRNAAEAVKDAQDGVVDAHRRVADAELGVVKAGREVEAAQRALAASGRDVEAAQRGVGEAEYQLAHSNEDAADAQERLNEARIEARKNLEDLANEAVDANHRITDAVRTVTSTETKLADAQRDSKDAQKALTQARLDATRQLEDLNEAASDSARSEQRAVIDLADARDELARITADPTASERDKQKAALDVADAEDRLSDATRERSRATKDAADANKKGVNGSSSVQQAIRGVITASRAEADARHDVAEAEHAVVDAQREAAQAARDLSKAQQDGIEGSQAVEDARRSLESANHQVAQSEQAVIDASQGVTDAQQRETDATYALQDARRGVGEAQQNVADAQRGVEKATRAVSDAQADLKETTQQGTGTMNTYLKALQKLSPAQRSFVKYIIGLNPLFDKLKQAAGEQLFQGVEKGVRSAMKNFDVLQGGLVHTSGVIGDLVEETGKLLGSKAFGKDLETIMGRNDVTIRRTGEGILNLTEATADLVIAAGPLVDWITKGTLAWTEYVKQQTQAGRDSGKLAAFFDETREVLTLVLNVTKNLGSALIDIGKLAYPLGRELLDALDKNVEKFREWTESAKGENVIKKYFDNAKPAIYEMFKLLEDITRALFRVGGGKDVAPLVKLLRTELLPVLEQLVTAASSAFGPAFIKAIAEILRLFEKLVGGGGPLVVFFELLNDVLSVVNKIIDKIPFIGTALGALIVVGGLSKILGIAAAITGINGLIKRIGLIKKALVASGVISAGAGAAGAAGTAAAGAAAGGAAAKGRGFISEVFHGLGTQGGSPNKPLFVWVVNGGGGVPIPGGGPGKPGPKGRLGGGLGGVAGKVAPVAAGAGAVAGGEAAVGAAAGAAGAGALATGAAVAGAAALPLVLIKLTEKDWKLDKLTGQLDALVDAPRGSKRFEMLTDLEKGLRDAVKAGDIGKMGQIAKRIREIGESTEGIKGKNFTELADNIDKAIEKLQPGAKKFQEILGRFKVTFPKLNPNNILDPNAVAQVLSNFNRIRRDGVRSLTDLRENVKFNTDQITKGFKEGTPEWSDAMQKNITIGIGAVRRGMKDGAIDTKKGIDEIQRLITRGMKVASGSMTTEIHDGIAAVSKGMRDGKLDTKEGMEKIAEFVRTNMQVSKENLDKMSNTGKQSLARNFRLAAEAVHDQMARAHKFTKEGMEKVRGYLAQELQVYGFTLKQAKAELLPGTRFDMGPEEGSRGPNGSGSTGNEQGGYYARGGWIGAKGMRGRDSVQIAPRVFAAPGEWHGVNHLGRGGVVVNRHQAPMAEMALRKSGGAYTSLTALGNAPGNQPGILNKAMRSTFGVGLGTLFNKVRRPHWMEEGGHYAGGGFLQLPRDFNRSIPPAHPTGGLDGYPAIDVFASPGTRVGAPISGKVVKTSGQAGGPGGGGAFGYSTYITGSGRTYFLTHFGSRSVRLGQSVRRGQVIGTVADYPDRADHIHEGLHMGADAVSGSSGGGGGARASRIKVPRVKGGGVVGSAVNRALTLAATAGQTLMNRAALSGGTGPEPAVGMGGTSGSFSNNRKLGKRMASDLYGWAGNQWNALNSLWQGESGWDEHADNPNSDAYGIPQANPGSKMASEGPNWRDDPGTQIRWGLKYIKNTPGYGDPVTTYSKWLSRSPHWYDEGGTYLSGGGGYTVGKLKKIQGDRIGDLDDIQGKIDRDVSVFESKDRIFGRTEEVYINPDTGEVDQKAIERRASELSALITIRQRINDNMKKMRTILRRVVKSYATIVKKLQNQLKHANKKDRAGIEKQIDHYTSERKSRKEQLQDLGFNIQDGKFDMDELMKEGAALRKIGPEPAEAPEPEPAAPGPEPAAPDGPGTTNELTPDQQAQLAQAERLKEIVATGIYLDTTSNSVLSGVRNPNDVGSVSPAAQPGYNDALYAKAAAMGVDLNAKPGQSAGPTTVVNNYINTLSPADPAMLTQIAKASNAGNTYLGTVTSPRESLGV